MARFPYDPFPTVNPIGAPGNDRQVIPSSPETFGAGVGEATEKLGGAVKGFGETLDQSGNKGFAAAMDIAGFQAKVSADDAYNKVQSHVLTTMYGDGSAENPGFYSLKGEAAFEPYKNLKQDLEEYRQEVGSKLNPAARLDFDQNSRRFVAQNLESAGRHYAEQVDTHAKDTNNATIDNSARTAGLNWNNEGIFNSSIAGAVKGAVRNGQLEGAGPERMDELIAHAKTQVITSTVEGALTRDPVAAYNFLQKHSDVLDAQSYDQLTARVRPLVADKLNNEWILGARTPASTADRIMQVESSGDAKAVPRDAKTGEVLSSAKGAGQFLDTTWLDVVNRYRPELAQGKTNAQVLALRDDKDLSREMTAHYADENARYLGDRGIAASPGNIYLAHFLGPGGAAAVLNSRPDTPIASILTPLQIAANKDALAGKTAADVQAWANGKMAGTGFGTPAAIPTKEDLITRAQTMFPDDAEMQREIISRGNSLINEITASHAAERAVMLTQLPDLVRGAEQGIAGLTLPANLEQTLKPGEAQKWRDEFAIASRVGGMMAGISSASEEDLAKMQADISSGQGVLSDMMRLNKKGATSGPGAVGADEQSADNASYLRLKEGAARAFEAQVQMRNAVLRDDPASYAALNPTVKAAFAAIDDKSKKPDGSPDPTSWENYAGAQIGMQTHLGVPEGAQHVLTRGLAMSFANEIVKSNDPADAVEGLKAKFGDAWGHVYKDMVTLGGLPGGYQSVIGVYDKDDPQSIRDAGLLARALNDVKPKADGQPGKSWQEMLGDAGGKSVAATINQVINTDTSVADLRHSLSASGASAHQIDDIVGSVQTLAYAKTFYDRQDASAAASQAIAAFTGKYEFLPNGGARIPSKFANATTQNAADLIGKMVKSDIAVPPQFDQPGMPSTEEYMSQLKAAPSWITSPKEDALWLMDPQGRIVRQKDGKPVAVPFSETSASQADQSDVLGGFTP